jgi:hypothetical protein
MKSWQELLVGAGLGAWGRGKPALFAEAAIPAQGEFPTRSAAQTRPYEKHRIGGGLP